MRYPYWAVKSSDLPSHDFSVDVIEPMDYDLFQPDPFPEGMVTIWVNEGVWPVASLPYECRLIPLSEIVAEIWPDAKVSDIK